MATIFLLLVGNFIYNVWLHWGLITIHSKKDPLSKIIRQIEKQGHVTLESNVDPNTPVNMWVTEVTLADAMETLSVVTESRWRLAYIVAGNRSAIKGAIASITSGQKTEGWKSVYYPLRGAEEQDVPVDPRKDPWNVKPVVEPTAQAYLEQAARSVSACFMFPEDWNPPVKSAPASGPIAKTLPKLASTAKGSYEEVFLLQKRQRMGRGERGENVEIVRSPRVAIAEACDHTDGDERHVVFEQGEQECSPEAVSIEELSHQWPDLAAFGKYMAQLKCHAL